MVRWQSRLAVGPESRPNLVRIGLLERTAKTDGRRGPPDCSDPITVCLIRTWPGCPLQGSGDLTAADCNLQPVRVLYCTVLFFTRQTHRVLTHF